MRLGTTALLLMLASNPPQRDGGTAEATRVLRERNGSVAFEAEHFSALIPSTTLPTHTWTVIKVPAASGKTALEATPNTGDGAKDDTTGARLDYVIDFQTAGTWFVWVRMLGASGDDDSVHVGLDSERASFGGLGLSMAEHGSWVWVNTVFNRITPKRVTVAVDQPGRHTFNIWLREDGTKIDKIVLTQDAATIEGLGPGSAAPSRSPAP